VHRIVGWIKGSAPFGIITAFRKEPSKEENYANATKLGETIKNAGYGFIRLDGGYVEDPETNPTPVVEFSYFVPGTTQNGVDKENHLKSLLLDEGNRYNQESIVYKAFANPQIELIDCKTGEVIDYFTDISFFSNIGQLWSALRRITRRHKPAA
jgi:hypothetical protein